MKEYIEERAVNIVNYIVGHNATVRQTAKMFGTLKSTVQIVVQNGTVLEGCIYGEIEYG